MTSGIDNERYTAVGDDLAEGSNRRAWLTTPTGLWNVVVAVGVAVLVASLLARGHYNAQLRVSSERRITAVSALSVMSVVGIGIAVIGRRRPRLGLVGLAGLSFSLAPFWLMLGKHRFAGPVVVHISNDHGIHLGDSLVVLPVIIGVGLLAVVATLRR